MSLEQTSNKNTIGMSGISITKNREKKFDFSTPYIFVSECILSLDSEKNINWNYKNTKIGYSKGTTSEQRIKILHSRYSIIPIPFLTADKRIMGLFTKKVNYIIADNIYVWQHEGIKIVHEFKEKKLSMVSLLKKEAI